MGARATVPPVRVTELWRFPVKSLQGERVDVLEVGPVGAVGDRRYALADGVSGKLLSAKKEARLLQASARTTDGEVLIVLPDSTELPAVSPEAARGLSRWLGREVDLLEVGDGVDHVYDMTFDPPNDDAEYYDIPTPAGTFVDLGALHVITTSSLAAMSAAGPELDWNIRRFRPNVVVDGAEDGFAEDAWVQREVRLGEEVRVLPFIRTMRCAMPLRAQPGMDRQVDIFRVMQDTHSNDLGVYCSVVATGTVAAGAVVEIGGDSPDT